DVARVRDGCDPLGADVPARAVDDLAGVLVCLVEAAGDLAVARNREDLAQASERTFVRGACGRAWKEGALAPAGRLERRHLRRRPSSIRSVLADPGSRPVDQSLPGSQGDGFPLNRQVLFRGRPLAAAVERELVRAAAVGDGLLDGADQLVGLV